VIGVTGTLTTAFLTGKATFRAAEVLREKAVYEPNGVSSNIEYFRELDTKEKIEFTWKLYIPAALSGAATVAIIIAANRVGSRRAAAIAAAYSLSERAFEQYKEKVIATIGAKKEQAVQDSLAQDRVNNDPLGSREVFVIGGAETLCHDAFSGRYFTCDVESLRRAENETNHQILGDGYASLTDLYYRIGLRPTAMSDEVGWTSDVLLSMKFSSVLTEDNRPCLSVNFVAGPIRNYHKFA